MLPTISAHAKSHEIEPVKKLGQNFIFDSSLCDKIAQSSKFTSNDIILEIGPGPAGLTRSILKLAPKKLIAIEMDKRCLNLLREVKNFYPNLDVIEGNALKIKISDLTNNSDKISIISNLPYNITSELLYSWFEEIHNISSITIMVQREVADRITSDISNKSYGKLSIMCQTSFNCKKLFDVPPHVFHPPPKVWSSIIQLTPKDHKISKNDRETLNKITSAAFNMRRKMLKSSFKEFSPKIFKIMNELKISTELRPENLTPDNFLDIARLFNEY